MLKHNEMQSARKKKQQETRFKMELNLRKQKKSEINSDRLSNPRPAMWILKQFVPKSIGIILQPFLPRDATQARPICRHAVSVCLSVCHVRELCQNE